MTFNVIEIARGGLANRGDFRKAPDGQFSFDLYGYPDKIEYHNSVYLHNPDIIEYYNSNGQSIKDYKGSVRSEYLFWDIDSKNIMQSYNDTVELISRLLDVGFDKEEIVVFFSGNKGYHLIASSYDISQLETDVELITKYVCMKLANGIESIDKVVYDKTRIIRIINSKHPTSLLYKVGFTVDEFLEYTPERIRGVAIEQKKTPRARKQTKSVAKVAELATSTEYSTEVYNADNNERHYRNLIDGVQDGARNNTLASLAGLLRSRNINVDTIGGIVHSVNSGFNVPLSSKEVDTIVRSIMRYQPDSSFKDLKGSNIITMQEAGKKWYEIRSKAGNIVTGLKHLDKELEFFDEGQVCMIAARAGTFKTTLAMQMANTISSNLGGNALFASLEMTASTLFFRAATITANNASTDGVSNREVATHLLRENELFRATTERWKNLLIVDQDSLTIEQIEQAYTIAQEKTNYSMNLLLIDYFGLIRGTNGYENASAVAREMKALAKRLNTRILLIVQLSREAGFGADEVEMNMLRDTGALEESADQIIGMWGDKKDSRLIHAKMLKNRYADEKFYKFDIINKGLYLSSVDAFNGKKGW